MLHGSRHDSVGDTGESTSRTELGQRQLLSWCLVSPKVPLCALQCGELDRDACSDTQERGESTLVEGEGSFILQDTACAIESRRKGAGSRGLHSDLDHIERLPDQDLGDTTDGTCKSDW